MSSSPAAYQYPSAMRLTAPQWLAANMVVPAFSIGVLGKQVFYIGFIDGILVIFFFNLIATFALCCFSTLGPAFGLRQMVLTRLWCGWYGAKICMSFPNLGIYWFYRC